ncbi:hypothetical protein AJ78_00062 [Emergomyces pasteurianus Ep9510]|uniref:Protein kinase domain-containing protein n=1 Tax=Emergomyces pasteurianus Ep9510 TaxID=1447872 RepID=A0A1J9PUU1_9EURO|nr:hypothetical protein AJ78_00062 [Emergomyces pasteurianus Ep9510]
MIVVPKGLKNEDEQSANIKKFREQMKALDDLPLGRLGMHSHHATAPISELRTPSQDPILIKVKKLGSGAFGDVTHRWNVSTGIEYAYNSVPCLYLDYLPGGNLMDQHRLQHFSTEDMQTILSQCLSALKYFHEQSPTIAHRDLKPENILVRSRKPLHVQLADFGLAKEGTLLKSQVAQDPTFPLNSL